MSVHPRPAIDFDHESYGARWFDSPDLADVFYAGPDEVQDADEPVVLPDADDWLMSYAARDQIPTSEE